MKKIMLMVFIAMFLAPASLMAAANNHYSNGVEGLKAATIAPPGFYYRMYNYYYDADTMTDKSGNKANIDFDIELYAMANRFLWVTEKTFLGADIFMDVTIPLVSSNLSIGMFDIDDDQAGLGDINLEPFGLSWHGQRYDAAFGLSVYMPTGDYDKKDPASVGRGYWTVMTTLGGTLYLDEAKSWSASVLGRYEVHSNRDGDDYSPGDDFHFEWGVAKKLARIFDVGLAGYCQWQVTDDSGADAVTKDHDRVFAVGPELSVFIAPVKSFLNLRILEEFDAKDRSEGTVAAMTLTYIF